MLIRSLNINHTDIPFFYILNFTNKELPYEIYFLGETFKRYYLKFTWFKKSLYQIILFVKNLPVIFKSSRRRHNLTLFLPRFCIHLFLPKSVFWQLCAWMQMISKIVGISNYELNIVANLSNIFIIAFKW